MVDACRRQRRTRRVTLSIRSAPHPLVQQRRRRGSSLTAAVAGSVAQWPPRPSSAWTTIIARTHGHARRGHAHGVRRGTEHSRAPPTRPASRSSCPTGRCCVRRPRRWPPLLEAWGLPDGPRVSATPSSRPAMQTPARWSTGGGVPSARPAVTRSSMPVIATGRRSSLPSPLCARSSSRRSAPVSVGIVTGASPGGCRRLGDRTANAETTDPHG